MPVEREFGADPALKRLYQVYLAIVLLGAFLWWMIPLVIFTFLSWADVGVIVALTCFAPLFLVVAIVLYWIPRFHASIQYVFEDDKIAVTRGVWWKTESFVPYNRITNVNINQGPISRHFGLGKLSVQTAGFSGTTSHGGKVAEAEIFGTKDFEEIKDMIMECVKGQKPEAIEAAAEIKPGTSVGQQMLAELRRIRKALEK
jgi:hypothetical protein